MTFRVNYTDVRRSVCLIKPNKDLQLLLASYYQANSLSCPAQTWYQNYSGTAEEVLNLCNWFSELFKYSYIQTSQLFKVYIIKQYNGLPLVVMQEFLRIFSTLKRNQLMTHGSQHI